MSYNRSDEPRKRVAGSRSLRQPRSTEKPNINTPQNSYEQGKI